MQWTNGSSATSTFNLNIINQLIHTAAAERCVKTFEMMMNSETIVFKPFSTFQFAYFTNLMSFSLSMSINTEIRLRIAMNI